MTAAVNPCEGATRSDAAGHAVADARRAQPAWAATPLRRRLATIRRARRAIAAQAAELAATVALPGRTLSDTLTAEVMPLCDAARFLEREASRLLKPRRLGRWGRPVWLRGVTGQVQREPAGVVLLLAPFNFPLLLPGVQALQALAAGNAVLLKPGRDGAAPATALADILHRAGVPRDVLQVLDESPATGEAAIDAGVDLVVLTGSVATGRAVMRRCADSLTPMICELSGDDPAIVLVSADVDLASRCIAFGAALNGGHTCIAPRRIIAHRSVVERLSAVMADLPTIAFDTDEQAVASANASDCALGASVFGEPSHARAIADRLHAGCVVVNDVIVPTADPRLPFGGRKQSGFGVTRGAEGLLQMTVLKSVTVRRGTFRPHLDPRQPGDDAMFVDAVRMSHAGCFFQRCRAAWRFIRAAAGRSRT
jgi:acyl-CoA reductase-like NAD-dependent aldehyde dehydrogenase